MHKRWAWVRTVRFKQWTRYGTVEVRTVNLIQDCQTQMRWTWVRTVRLKQWTRYGTVGVRTVNLIQDCQTQMQWTGDWTVCSEFWIRIQIEVKHWNFNPSETLTRVLVNQRTDTCWIQCIQASKDNDNVHTWTWKWTWTSSVRTRFELEDDSKL